MTLRGILTAQLPLQVRWTCEARLARSFAASVLAENPARCYVRQRESINALSGVFFCK